MVTEKPVFDKKGRTWTNMHAVDGKWILESNAGRTGWVYRWFRDNILCEKPSPRIYETMNALAAGSPPGSNGVKVYMGPHVFNVGPTILEGRHDSATSPVPPTILGSSRFTRGDLARAILEANCYAVRANLEQLTEITGAKVRTLGFCGGNSKAETMEQDSGRRPRAPVIRASGEGRDCGRSRDMCRSRSRYPQGHEDSHQRRWCTWRSPSSQTLHSPKEYDKLYESWIETRRHLSGVL